MDKIIFYDEQNIEIPAGKAFELTYSGLAQFLAINREFMKLKEKKSEKAAYIQMSYPDTSQDAIKKWSDGRVSVTAKIGNGLYYIFPAPIKQNMIKEPDILYLHRDVDITRKPMESNLVVRRLHERDISDYKLYMKEIKGGSVKILPEKTILDINDVLLKNSLPSITYNPVKKWIDEGQHFVLRTFYPSIQDTGICPQSVELYVALMAELGILSRIDDKAIEYMVNDIAPDSSLERVTRALINIDPDFWAIAENRGEWNLHGEAKRIYDLLSESIIPRTTFNHFKKGVKKYRDYFADNHSDVFENKIPEVIEGSERNMQI